ncbi:MAG TPA: HlyD family efflux transporter periplasmic adaptor subunit [Candidatus Acidoferrales bacterium]|nr:HlyD family efflux transporter periplasmic adaptor subunit [Candidatus Acidoferrales bacterium]
MRFGPSGLRASRVLAKGLHRPKVRSDIRVSRQNVAGEISYVIKISETASYNRYGSYEFELLQAFDGTRTAAEAAEYMNERYPDTPIDEATILDFLEGIPPDMWERTVGEKNLAILERLRDERKSRLDQSNLLYITFKAWDPDKVLSRLDPVLSWMYTRGFIYFSVGLFLLMLWLLSGDWSRIAHDTKELWNFSDKSAYYLWVFWLLMLVIGGIHEFGHGLTCKHYGGEVHQMGFMLIYLTPAFFTDTTDVLMMDRVAPRQWTIFAGIWVELLLCSISAVIWHFTLPGSTVNGLAYMMMLLCGIQGTLLNLNPLIKADGYYALCQYLQIDNLREDSFEFLQAWLLQNALRRQVELPAASRRQRKIFLTYSLTALVYSITLITVVLLWLKNVCINKFGAWGYVIFAAAIYFFAHRKIRKLATKLPSWWVKAKEGYMAWKLTRRQTVGMAVAVVLLTVPPIPSRISVPCILEPSGQAEARAAVSGVVQQVLVRQGEQVQQGQVLAVLENPLLASAVAVDTQQLALEQSRLRSAEGAANADAAATASREVTRLEKYMEIAQREYAQLQVRAPIAATVTTPELAETVGEYLPEGETFCHLSSRTEMRVRILVHDWAADDVRPGARLLLKVSSYPLRTYSGRVDRIMPAMASDRPVGDPTALTRYGQELANYMAVIADLPNPDGSLREGMTGTVKIYSPARSIVWQVGRGTWRWLRSQFW